ncbi:MAG: hypothetical protein P4L10_00335 [Acidobacteriaceae bacterium]|nr:hypothetical protein [Acidobacteriaceae bacterium]
MPTGAGREKISGKSRKTPIFWTFAAADLVKWAKIALSFSSMVTACFP